MRRMYWPLHTKLTVDVLEVEMVLPSGQPGIRHYGQRVLVRIDRDLGVEIREAVFGERVLLSGGWNLCSVCWAEQAENVSDRELCSTALEMVDARVAATVKLFSRGWLDASWLTPRAQYEVGL